MTIVPRRLEEIDRAFVQRLIAQVHPDADVADIAISGAVHGTATKVRLKITYARPTDAPGVVWLKGGYEPHSATLFGDGIYAAEPRAYAELLPQLAMRAPRHHGAVYDMAAGEGVVLLEDLGGNTIHSPESTISIYEAAAMLTMLAQMHGTTSRPGWLDEHSWLSPVMEGYGEPRSYFTYMGAPQNIERFLKWPRAETFPPGLRDPHFISNAFRRVHAWSTALSAPCLIHGDAHVGNTYADAWGRPGLLDWQCVRRGSWAFDVSYYLVSALTLEQRRAHEHELLEHYWSKLEAAGGPRVDRNDALNEYRVCLGYGLVAWLSNDPALQPEHYNTIVSNRFAWAMDDHGLLAN